MKPSKVPSSGIPIQQEVSKIVPTSLKHNTIIISTPGEDGQQIYLWVSGSRSTKWETAYLHWTLKDK